MVDRNIIREFDVSDEDLVAAMGAVFLAFYYLPMGSERFKNAVLESLHLAKWYAQEHVLLCLVPAFFILLHIAPGQAVSCLPFSPSGVNRF